MTTPIPPNGDRVRRDWQQALQAGPSCLALERLGEPLTAVEAAHVATCVRCQTELEMFAAYDADAPIAGEGLSVAWIEAQARRRVAADLATPPASAALAPRASPAAPAPPLAPAGVAPASKVTWAMPRWLLAAASLVVVVGGAALLWNPAPTVETAAPGAAPIYRAARIEVTSPTGDVPDASPELRFTAVLGAVDYEVRLLEVDGTELWRATTPSPAVTVPADVTAFALPAKTLIWRVSARDAQQRVLAESGDVRVRVQPR